VAASECNRTQAHCACKAVIKCPAWWHHCVEGVVRQSVSTGQWAPLQLSWWPSYDAPRLVVKSACNPIPVVRSCYARRHQPSPARLSTILHSIQRQLLHRQLIGGEKMNSTFLVSRVSQSNIWGHHPNPRQLPVRNCTVRQVYTDCHNRLAPKQADVHDASKSTIITIRPNAFLMNTV